jgi:hypothetical protein
MKVLLGNHSKIVVHKDLKQKVRDFYISLLGCKAFPAPSSTFELFEFENGFIFGVSFAEEGEYLSEDEQLRGTWLELKTDRPQQLKERLLAFGVKQIDYHDKAHFYFQAPGGQIFRLLALSEN